MNAWKAIAALWAVNLVMALVSGNYNEVLSDAVIITLICGCDYKDKQIKNLGGTP